MVFNVLVVQPHHAPHLIEEFRRFWGSLIRILCLTFHQVTLNF